MMYRVFALLACAVMVGLMYFVLMKLMVFMGIPLLFARLFAGSCVGGYVLWLMVK